MKYKQLYNLGLRFPWNIHARIVFFTTLGSLLFTLIADNGSLINYFALSFLIMFVDHEIFF